MLRIHTGFRGGNPRSDSVTPAHLCGPHDDAVAVHCAPSAAFLLFPPQAHCHWTQHLIQSEEVLMFWRERPPPPPRAVDDRSHSPGSPTRARPRPSLSPAPAPSEHLVQTLSGRPTPSAAPPTSYRAKFLRAGSPTLGPMPRPLAAPRAAHLAFDAGGQCLPASRPRSCKAPASHAHVPRQDVRGPPLWPLMRTRFPQGCRGFQTSVFTSQKHL